MIPWCRNTLTEPILRRRVIFSVAKTLREWMRAWISGTSSFNSIQNLISYCPTKTIKNYFRTIWSILMDKFSKITLPINSKMKNPQQYRIRTAPNPTYKKRAMRTFRLKRSKPKLWAKTKSWTKLLSKAKVKASLPNRAKASNPKHSNHHQLARRQFRCLRRTCTTRLSEWRTRWRRSSMLSLRTWYTLRRGPM